MWSLAACRAAKPSSPCSSKRFFGRIGDSSSAISSRCPQLKCWVAYLNPTAKIKCYEDFIDYVFWRGLWIFWVWWYLPIFLGYSVPQDRFIDEFPPHGHMNLDPRDDRQVPVANLIARLPEVLLVENPDSSRDCLENWFCFGYWCTDYEIYYYEEGEPWIQDSCWTSSSTLSDSSESSSPPDSAGGRSSPSESSGKSPWDILGLIYR